MKLLIAFLLSINLYANTLPEEPKSARPCEVIHHTSYTTCYEEEFEQAQWVAYELTSAETENSFERSNKFLVDASVSTGSANDGDYKSSGYDRGHLAPAGDMSFNEKSMKESFYYSNMSPQTPSFNRGIWKNLESQVRQWAKEYNKVYVVTGGILEKNLPTIGKHVAIPKMFYKVILDTNTEMKKGIAFILPNEASKLSIKNYAVSIDSLENLTGIDFFPMLELSSIESNLCFDCWTWNTTHHSSQKIQETSESKSHSDIGKSQSDISIQCKGITKKGNQCKRMTTNKSGFCFQHER